MIRLFFILFASVMTAGASYKDVSEVLDSKQTNVDFLTPKMSYSSATRVFLKRISQSEILKDFRVRLHEDLTRPEVMITPAELSSLQRACKSGCTKGEILSALIIRMRAEQRIERVDGIDILTIFTHRGGPPILADVDDGKWADDKK